MQTAVEDARHALHVYLLVGWGDVSKYEYDCRRLQVSDVCLSKDMTEYCNTR